MSLYHEATSVLGTARKQDASIKSLVYGKKGWKSDPKTLYALSTQAAKWSEVLSEVIEKSGVLSVEKLSLTLLRLSPTLALVLVHDLFLSKKGVALPSSHGLYVAVARHKVRLSAELTKARLRRGCATLEALRVHIDNQVDDNANGHDVKKPLIRNPRWIRINTLKTSVVEQMATTFSDYTKVSTLGEVKHGVDGARPKTLYIDEHIPNLIAISPSVDIVSSKAYRSGCVILQDKASCFPAYLLNPSRVDGDIIDACAAPGNKTTHLAAILHENTGNDGGAGSITACEKDLTRSRTLQNMVRLASGDGVIHVKEKQDFLRLDASAKEFANVTALLLDPSCSGSGIVGRDEGGITVHLPSAPTVPETVPKGQKRKRSQAISPQKYAAALADETAAVEETPDHADGDDSKLRARLANLSAFQLKLLQHAMTFPGARRITYSTCSVHAEENEEVVVKALQSHVAKERHWRIMRREEQVAGMRKWHRRGWEAACKDHHNNINAREVADACIRCIKGSDDGTMGFFVAGFVRNVITNSDEPEYDAHGATQLDEVSEEEWNGFGEA